LSFHLFTCWSRARESPCLKPRAKKWKSLRWRRRY